MTQKEDTTKYFAHSTETQDKSTWQPLSEHLLNVAKRAEIFTTDFQAEKWGRISGLLHDSGKATAAFTRRLEGSAERVDHATFGARIARERVSPLGILLSYAIAGHHGGLPNGGMQEGQLHFRLNDTKIAEDTCLLQEADISAELRTPFIPDPKTAVYSLALFTRMIFSCLVDADFLDTEEFCSPDKAADRVASEQIKLKDLKTTLERYISHIETQAANSKVNTLRKEIVNQCRKSAGQNQGFFSLTVPTGGGKTLSSLTFALEHAAQHNLSRIIYTIPFTSIIEQNAQVFRMAIGDRHVLEHHCNYKGGDTGGEDNKWGSLATENWNAPVIVTTNVQFFESLYSHKTSRCRKLHNIAGSVIVLDEAQAIPTEFLEPCLAALRELVVHYRCSVVLCTATQPTLDDRSVIKIALPTVREIINSPSQLFADLKRVRIEHIGKCATTDLAARLKEQQHVLCIVSTKKQAQQIFTELNATEDAFHLSTNLYPAHRLEVLAVIRKHLAEDLPCRVIATSLVEAGVDLDFPVVYRAMAGLDSIAQAAGRCNREGRLDFGQVYVYEPEEMPAMPWLRRRISRARETLRSLPDGDWLGLATLQRYFTLLFDAEDLDKHNIVKRLNPPLHKDLILPFRDVSEDFRLIADEGTGVIVPATAEIARIVEQLPDAPVISRAIRQKLQQYSVTVRQSTLTKLEQSGAVETICGCYPILRNMHAYHPALGLMEENTEIWDPESLIC